MHTHTATHARILSVSPFLPTSRFLRPLAVAALPLAALALGPTPASWAQGSTYVLSGTVLDSKSEPLENAAIYVGQIESAQRTAKDGTFRVSVDDPGPIVLVARRPDHVPGRVLVETVPEGGETNVGVVSLRKVESDADRAAVQELDEWQFPQLRKFYERRETRRQGVFLAPDELAKHGNTDLNKILRRLPRVQRMCLVVRGDLDCGMERNRGPSTILGGPPKDRRCLPRIWSDGNPRRLLLSEIRMDQVLAFEAYAESGTTPPEFAGSQCGAIMLWLKEPKYPMSALAAGLVRRTAPPADVAAAIPVETRTEDESNGDPAGASAPPAPATANVSELVSGRAISYDPAVYAQAILAHVTLLREKDTPTQRPLAERLKREIVLLMDKSEAAGFYKVHRTALEEALAAGDSAKAAGHEASLYEVDVSLRQSLPEDSAAHADAVKRRVGEAAERRGAALARAQEAEARRKAAAARAAERDGRAKYTGPSKNARPEGVGVMEYPDGGRYEGELVGGRRSGKGVHDYPNGDRYEGEFVNGRPEGQGTFLFASGTRYVGTFANGTREGEGVLELSTGERYTGEFHRGVFHGQGVLEYRQGGRYEGQWAAGKREGEGREEYAHGRVLIGVFENDRVVGEK